MKLTGTTAAVALLGALCSSLPASASLSPDWKAALRPAAEGDFHRPGEALRVALPVGIDGETVQWLALELDRVDVTRVVALDGLDAVVTPPAPLGAGKHVLRLVEYNRQGGIVERGEWAFEVLAGRSADIRSEATLNASSRAVDHDLAAADLPDGRFAGDGIFTLEASAGAGRLKIGGNIDVLYQSEPSQPEFDKVEGGDFLLRADAGPVSLSAGHHTPAPESLIFQDFHRRGASIGYESGSGKVAAGGFALRTGRISGFRHGIGIDDAENRVAGGFLTARPIPGRPDWLEMTGALIYGKQGADPDPAVLDDGGDSSGSGWSLVATSQGFGGAVRLRAEFAETDFDPDGSRGEAREEDDRAWALRATWLPLGAEAGDAASLAWTIGAEYREVGGAFRSLGNPGLPDDLSSGALRTGIGWKGLGIDLLVEREEDNVEDSPQLPTARTDVLGLSLAYSPLFGDGGPPRWLGRPSVSLSARQARDTTRAIPEGDEQEATDLRHRDLKGTVGAAGAWWDWAVAHNTGRQEDFTGSTPVIRSDVTDLSFGLRPSGRLDFGITAQRYRSRQIGTSQKRVGTIAGITVAAVIIPERLTLRLGAQYDREETADGGVDRRTDTEDFDLALTVSRARGVRPGLTVWLRGQRQHVEDWTGANDDSTPYQIFGGFTLAWAAASPAAQGGSR